MIKYFKHSSRCSLILSPGYIDFMLFLFCILLDFTPYNSMNRTSLIAQIDYRRFQCIKKQNKQKTATTKKLTLLGRKWKPTRPDTHIEGNFIKNQKNKKKTKSKSFLSGKKYHMAPFVSFFLYRSVVIRFHSLEAGRKLVRIRDMAPRNLQARARHFIRYAPNRIARADLPVPSMPWFRNAVAALWIPER